MSDQVKLVVIGLLMLVAAFFLVGTLKKGCVGTGGYAMANANVEAAVSARLAKAVAEQQQPGKVVLIRFLGFIPSTKALQKVQVDAFKRALPSGYSVVDLPPIGMADDAHGDWVLRSSGGNWGGEMLEWMSAHGDAVAVVSLVGVPQLSPTQWESLPPFYGSVVVANQYHEEMLKRGVLKGLVVEREDADAVAIREFRGSQEALFDLAYELRTPGGP